MEPDKDLLKTWTSRKNLSSEEALKPLQHTVDDINPALP